MLAFLVLLVSFDVDVVGEEAGVYILMKLTTVAAFEDKFEWVDEEELGIVSARKETEYVHLRTGTAFHICSTGSLAMERARARFLRMMVVRKHLG